MYKNKTGIDDQLVGRAESNVASLFLLVNVTVRRAEQLTQGAVPGLALRAGDPIEGALREIAEGRLKEDEEQEGTWILQPDED